MVTAAHCVEGQSADLISVNIILALCFSPLFFRKYCIFSGEILLLSSVHFYAYDSIATVGETGVWLRAKFQSGSRVLKKVF